MKTWIEPIRSERNVSISSQWSAEANVKTQTDSQWAGVRGQASHMCFCSSNYMSPFVSPSLAIILFGSFALIDKQHAVCFIGFQNLFLSPQKSHRSQMHWSHRPTHTVLTSYTITEPNLSASVHMWTVWNMLVLWQTTKQYRNHNLCILINIALINRTAQLQQYNMGIFFVSSFSSAKRTVWYCSKQ